MRSPVVVLLFVAGCASKPAPSPPMAITETTTRTAAPVTSAAAPQPATAPTPALALTPPPADPADVAHENALGWKLLEKTGRPGDNALVSGASVRQALAPLLLGARGTTADEMAQALGLDKDPTAAVTAEQATWHDAMGKHEAGAPAGVALAVANRVWIDDGFVLLPDYAKTVGAAATVDFAKPETRATINAWVSENTRAKIPELLPAGAVDARTKLVVTNAIWFKGRWGLPFATTLTKDEPFKTGMKTVNVPTMHLADSFRYAASGGLRILELRYADSQLAMDVILADDGKLPKIDPAKLDDATKGLASVRVSVSLPKLAFKSGAPLKDALAALGMKTAFTDRADFSGMVDPKASEHLSIGQVFHQTWIAVDEAGTEAAAATGMVMRTTAMQMGPVVDFKVDHPFVFVVRETQTGRILFSGRVTDPKAL